MKLGNWRSRTRQAEPAASQLVPALDRVREMREQSAWEPLTAPSSIRERADEVAEARKRVTIPPLASEHGGASQQRTLISPWLRESLRSLLYGSSILLAFMLTTFLLTEEERPTPEPAPIERTTIAFRLSEKWSFGGVSEEEAIAFARRVLKSLVVRVGDWNLEAKRYAEPEMFFRRASNYEGTILFRHSRYSSLIVRVKLKVDPDEKIIVCTVDPY